MSDVDPDDRANLEAIWRAASALKSSKSPVVEYFARHVLVETSAVLNQLVLYEPDTAPRA